MPRVPALAQRLPLWIDQISPSEYRNPAQLGDGAVLVVGASATGVQLAAEYPALRQDCHHFSGEPHPVAAELSWARHLVVARTDRLLDETTAAVSDLQRACAQPSFQLVGGPDGQTLDLGTLRDMGVRIVGRTIGAADHRASPR